MITYFYIILNIWEELHKINTKLRHLFLIFMPLVTTDLLHINTDWHDVRINCVNQHLLVTFVAFCSTFCSSFTTRKTSTQPESQ